MRVKYFNFKIKDPPKILPFMSEYDFEVGSLVLIKEIIYI